MAFTLAWIMGKKNLFAIGKNKKVVSATPEHPSFMVKLLSAIQDLPLLLYCSNALEKLALGIRIVNFPLWQQRKSFLF